MTDTIQLSGVSVKKRTKGDSKKPIFAPAQAEGLREVAALVTIRHSEAAIKVAKNLLKLADYLESDERKEKTKKAVGRKNRATALKQLSAETYIEISGCIHRNDEQ